MAMNVTTNAMTTAEIMKTAQNVFEIKLISGDLGSTGAQAGPGFQIGAVCRGGGQLEAA